MRRVLVTGAGGFIGRHCLTALADRADEIHALSERPQSAGSPAGSCETAGEVRWHQADLLDRGSVEALLDSVRPSHLLHLAWFSGHREIYSSPENNRWVRASLGLLAAFQGRGGKRAVFTGSCAEYDWSEGLCSEHETPLRPASVYGASKVSTLR